MLKKIYNDFDDNYRESLINRIKVNKKGELTYTNILQNYNLSYINNKADISKDILYEEKKINIINCHSIEIIFPFLEKK